MMMGCGGDSRRTRKTPPLMQLQGNSQVLAHAPAVDGPPDTAGLTKAPTQALREGPRSLSATLDSLVHSIAQCHVSGAQVQGACQTLDFCRIIGP